MASIIPLTLGLDAMRQLMFASGPSLGFLPVRAEIGTLLVLSILFVAAAKYWLDRMERLAVQEGTLTDRRREETMKLITFRRSFFPAAWLGWQVESNWTDPFVFFAFSVLKPIAGVMILVFMYQAVSLTGTGSPIYAYIYLGNSFYIYVGAVMAGASYSILDDRERYRSLKYLYIAPINIPMYLFGRAVARFLTGTLAVVITITAGIVFFKVPINPLRANWPMFIAALFLGVPGRAHRWLQHSSLRGLPLLRPRCP